ncbi:MAG: alpha/beta hydrolase [Pseudomonadota bacterium]
MNRLVPLGAPGMCWAERPGENPTLVLLHGIGSWSGGFASLLPHLPDRLRVIAWDAPGYGGSDPLEADWPVAADYAVALERWLAHLGVEGAVLAGHSLGALIAGAYAARFEGRITRLVLASPALGHGVPVGDPLSDAARARIEALERLGPTAFAAARAPGLIHAPQDHPQLVATVEAGMARIRLPGYAQAARMLDAGRLLADLARVSVPTDIVFGAEDRITPPDRALAAHAALPEGVRGRLTEIPGTGHALTAQAPAAFAAALSAALSTALA